MEDFDEALFSLDLQAAKEIIQLKNHLNEISDDEFRSCDDKRADALEWIFYTMEGLRKIAGVAEYLMCWADNGAPPTLSKIDNGCHKFN